MVIEYIKVMIEYGRVMLEQQWRYLTVETDSAPLELSVDVEANLPLLHLRVVVAVEGVPVAVTLCNT